MPPKKRSRAVSAPPAHSTPGKDKAALAAGAGSAATPKHAGTDGKKPKAPRTEAGSPPPRAAAAAASPKTDKGSSSSHKKKGRRESLSLEGRALRLGTSVSPLAKEATEGRTSHQSPIRPMKLDLAGEEDAVVEEQSARGLDAGEVATFTPTNTAKDLESVVLRSKVIAPDISGVSCLAANQGETEVVVARENGSLVLYGVSYFQNIPHFTQLRSTGGRVRRTITRLAFLDLSALVDTSSSSSSSLPRDRYFAASYLSGQIVLYDSETLFPVSVYQRAGGAVWDMCVVEGCTIYAALADGSWHRLRVVLSRPAGQQQQQQQPRPTLELERIIPRIAGADRAFSVTSSSVLGVVVGTDDAGNVHAWRHASNSSSGSHGGNKESTNSSDGASPGGLSSHDTLWTCRLPKGLAMCCAIADGGAASADGGGTAVSRRPVRPVVAVGTSMGDVVFIDLQHGHILHTFTTHKGPVCTIICAQNVFYASGWHESLRAFRYANTASSSSSQPGGGGGLGDVADGEWYPAEVKRRTHYHEASELLVLPRCQLLLSGARDGTIMFAPLAQLFSSPAMYVTVTTQRFAFAQGKNVLLQTRLDRIEAFRMDAALRHWTPLFAHNVHGKFHLNGLWCDPQLHFVVFSTDERVVLSRIGWREGAESALAISRIEEVLELPAGRGLVDVLFVPSERSATNEGSGSVEEEVGVGDDAAVAGVATGFSEGALYLLFDDCVLYVTLADGFPVIRTELHASPSLRPTKVAVVVRHRPDSEGEEQRRTATHKDPNASGSVGATTTTTTTTLHVFGLRGQWRCELAADGTPNPDTACLSSGPAATYTHVTAVPLLSGRGRAAEGGGSGGAAATATASDRELSSNATVVVGLSVADGRYVRNITSSAAGGASVSSPKEGGGSASRVLPKSLPHDVTFVAEMQRATRAKNTEGHEDGGEETRNYVGYFSKGLVFVGHREWRMAARMSVEAAFVMRDRRHVLVLERNLEKTLEALPLCWKVRRFGN